MPPSPISRGDCPAWLLQKAAIGVWLRGSEESIAWVRLAARPHRDYVLGISAKTAMGLCRNEDVVRACHPCHRLVERRIGDQLFQLAISLLAGGVTALSHSESHPTGVAIPSRRHALYQSRLSCSRKLSISN